MSDSLVSWDLRNKVGLLYGKWKLREDQYYTMTRAEIKRLAEVLIKFESGIRISVIRVMDKK